MTGTALRGGVPSGRKEILPGRATKLSATGSDLQMPAARFFLASGL